MAAMSSFIATFPNIVVVAGHAGIAEGSAHISLMNKACHTGLNASQNVQSLVIGSAI